MQEGAYLVYRLRQEGIEALHARRAPVGRHRLRVGGRGQAAVPVARACGRRRLRPAYSRRVRDWAERSSPPSSDEVGTSVRPG